MPTNVDDRAREGAARIRAVRSYANLTQQQLADLIGVSLATMKRMESGARPISTDELLLVGDAAQAPPEFMLHGYAAITETPTAVMPLDCVQRFAEIEVRLSSVETTLRRLHTDDGS